MKRLLIILVLAWVATGHTQPVTLAWDASSSPGVTSYRLYYGTNSRSYSFVTNTGLVRTQTVVLPHTGRWFFAATVSDTIGMESEFSNEAEWEAKPTPPVMRGEPWVRLSPVIERSTNQVDWVSTIGAPTFFATRRLVIEQVQRVITP